MSAGYINHVEIMGNLGANPKSTKLDSGDLVVSISIATTDKWTDKSTGEAKEATEWHQVVIFGKLAAVAMQYLKTGSKILIKGKLRTRKFTDKDGVDRFSTSIVVSGRNSEFHLLGDPKDKPENSSLSEASSDDEEPPVEDI